MRARRARHASCRPAPWVGSSSARTMHAHGTSWKRPPGCCIQARSKRRKEAAGQYSARVWNVSCTTLQYRHARRNLVRSTSLGTSIATVRACTHACVGERCREVSRHLLQQSRTPVITGDTGYYETHLCAITKVITDTSLHHIRHLATPRAGN